MGGFTGILGFHHQIYGQVKSRQRAGESSPATKPFGDGNLWSQHHRETAFGVLKKFGNLEISWVVLIITLPRKNQLWNLNHDNFEKGFVLAVLFFHVLVVRLSFHVLAAETGTEMWSNSCVTNYSNEQTDSTGKCYRE